MKIYVLDLGYLGGFVVIAKTKTEAFEMMQSEYEYSEIHNKSEDNLQEFPLQEGFLYRFSGDA